MNRHPPLPRGGSTGFSLIELVVIIVVMAIAATGVIALNAGIFSGQDDNADLQVGSALMQECGELILAKRQKAGFGSTSPHDLFDTASATAFCKGATADPTMTVTVTPVTSGTDPCPSEAKFCKLMVIKHGAQAPVTLLLTE